MRLQVYGKVINHMRKHSNWYLPTLQEHFSLEYMYFTAINNPFCHDGQVTLDCSGPSIENSITDMPHPISQLTELLY